MESIIFCQKRKKKSQETATDFMQTVLVLSVEVLLLWTCKAFCLQLKERKLEEEITFFSRKQSTSPPPSLCCFQVKVSISGGAQRNYLLIWSRPGTFRPQPVGNQAVRQLKQAPYFCDRWFCAGKKKNPCKRNMQKHQHKNRSPCGKEKA